MMTGRNPSPKNVRQLCRKRASIHILNASFKSMEVLYFTKTQNYCKVFFSEGGSWENSDGEKYSVASREISS